MPTHHVWSSRIRHGVRIPMRDGTRLSADLYLPDGEGPWPVVIEYQPYRKDEVDSEKRFYTYLPEHGHVVCRIDVRGTGASGGSIVDEYVADEQNDGYDSIEWLAAQDFCDGNVHMMGISYGGFTALQVATTQPPHLRSIIPMYFTDDRYQDDCHYVGGHPRLYYDIGFYGNFMVAYNALPADPQYSDDWAEVWQEHLAGNEPFYLTWLRNQTDTAYWRHGSVGDIADRIQVPVFMIGGWWDGYRNTTPRLFEKLSVPKRALIGPWNHAVPDEAVPGPRIDHLHEVVRWLDHWSGRPGGDPGIGDSPVVVWEQHFEPPVNADRVTQPGRWRAERSWPPEGATQTTMYLADRGALDPSVGDDGHDTMVYDATVGVTGGLWSGGVAFGLPGDQRPDQALSATYTSTVLDEDLHMLGRAVVHLHFSTSATVLGFAASLSDVAPDGSTQLIAKGMLNATRRHSMADPRPLVPGEEYELAIEIDCTSWRVRAGHRLRLSLSNADWPNVWPTPEAATSRLYRGTARPSRVTLPTVPSRSGVEAPSFRPVSSAVPHRQHTEPPTWQVERDALSRAATVRYHFDYADRVNAHTTVARSYDFETHVDPDLPAQAVARGRHHTRISRRGSTIAATSATSVTGTATTFHVVIDVEVVVDGVQRFARGWTDSIPRCLC